MPVRRASLMCIEKMIDGMSDACYLEHYCFRHRLHSCSLAARFLRIATCHTSSLFCVTTCHMTSCIIKTAAPILFGAVVSSCKASQIFFHILILRKASIMSPMCSGCGGRAFEPHCSAPRERHDESRVFLFSQIFHIPT